jgi:hypothetical protein
MKHGARRYCFWIGLRGAFTLVLFGALFYPGEALGQARYWSTARGINGVRGPAPAPTAQPSPSSDQSETTTPLRTSPSQLADRSEARASLRYDWDALKEKEQETQDTQLRSKASDSVKPKDVAIELFIDARTDASLRRLAADRGIPYQKLLYEFLRIGHTVYTERLFCARSRY